MRVCCLILGRERGGKGRTGGAGGERDARRAVVIVVVVDDSNVDVINVVACFSLTQKPNDEQKSESCHRVLIVNISERLQCMLG